MKHTFALIMLLLMAAPAVMAQKPFIEGFIVYKAQIEMKDGNVVGGTYTFTFKNGRIRKELKLNNGYEDVIIINNTQKTAYSLQGKGNRKYAIQLNVDELEKEQAQYAGYMLDEDKKEGKIIAGITAFKGRVRYKDGTASDIYYTAEWCPDKSLTYDRFPDAKFLPLSYSYNDKSGAVLRLEAEKVDLQPVESSLFRVPSDYKIISYKEYKGLNR